MVDYTAKMGDAKTLVRQLGHDLTATGAVRLVISHSAREQPVVSRTATIEDAEKGLVSAQLHPSDYGTGRLELPEADDTHRYLVEWKTGEPRTVPDTPIDSYDNLLLLRSLEDVPATSPGTVIGASTQDHGHGTERLSRVVIEERFVVGPPEPGTVATGVAFRAPANGVVSIYTGIEASSADSTVQTMVGPEVREGDTIGAGTIAGESVGAG